MLNQHKLLRVLQLINQLKAKPAKSLRQLAKTLDSTERTVYRYIDLLEAVGFNLHKDTYRRYSIPDEESATQGMSFTQEETVLLRELIVTAAAKNKLKDSLLKKLYIASDLHILPNHLLKAHLSKIVSTLGLAIQEQKQVILKKYQSGNSQDVRDRLVEPIRFSDNYQSLTAYEPESGKNKLFNIERIAAVEVTRKSFAFADEHKYTPPDVFGYGETGKKYDVDLLLSLKAYMLLKEEFPMAEAFVKPDRKSGKHRFRTSVNSYKAVSRFTLGLLDEIEVLGPKEFREHLRKIISRRL
jgi:predicted DNA-binding transcriptional regulator YafY